MKTNGPPKDYRLNPSVGTWTRGRFIVSRRLDSTVALNWRANILAVGGPFRPSPLDKSLAAGIAVAVYPSSVTANGEGAFMMINGDVIYCDCCGTEKLAQVVGDNLIIKDRRHGIKHVAVISISDLLDILQKRNHNLNNERKAAGAAEATLAGR